MMPRWMSSLLQGTVIGVQVKSQETIFNIDKSTENIIQVPLWRIKKTKNFTFFSFDIEVKYNYRH